MKGFLWAVFALWLMLLCGCAYPQPVQETQVVHPPTIPTEGTYDWECISANPIPLPEISRAELAIMTFAYENGLSVDAYPQSIVELLERNPETEEFVLNYPLEYGREHEVDLSAWVSQESVPLFIQWDRRWGYLDYGNDVAGLTACGPLCLSMAAFYFTKDEAMSPDRIVQFALDNGFCAPGNGSYWSLIGDGGRMLGLDVTPVYQPDRETVEDNLAAGNLIICVVGPGDFTSEGHFILLAGLEDGRIIINDPNSYRNSQKRWSYAGIADQIIGMWILRYFGE